MSIIRIPFRLVAIALLALMASACGSDSQSGSGSVSTFKLPADLAELTASRAIDRDSLFAEVILRYDDVEERVIASRTPGTDDWQANFRLPGGHDYSIELTWYDTVDGGRLDLVRFNRNFSAIFNSGPISFDFDDYDFDGYDADQDGIVNLAERQAGTSPLIAEDTNAAVQLCTDGTVIAVDAVCTDEAEPALELGFSQLLLSAMPDATTSNNILISNTGSAPLNFTARSDQPWLQLQDGPGSNGVGAILPAGESVSLALQASCGGAIEMRSATISVESDGGNDNVSVTLDCRGAILAVSPELYQFAAQIVGGVGQSASDTMTLSNGGNAPLEFTVTSDSDWLCPLSPESGNCESAGYSAQLAEAGSVEITVLGQCPDTPQMLAGSLIVTSNGGSGIFPATIDCTLAPMAQLSVLPQQINLGATLGQLSNTDITIANSGNAPLEFNVSSDSSWLQTNTAQGTVQADTSSVVQLQAQCGNAVETLTGALAVDTNVGAVSIPVALECSQAPAPLLTLQTMPVTLSTELGLAVASSFELANTGSADLTYTLSATQGWLQLNDTGGSLASGAGALLTYQASCGDSVENRSAEILIDSNGGSASLPVTLQCTAPPMAQLAVQTVQLTLTAQQNATVTSSISFANTGNAALDYTLTASPAWLQLASDQGSLAAGDNAAVPISASCDDIVQTRNGTIDINSDAGSDSIAVSLDCSALPQPQLVVETIDIALTALQDQSASGDIMIANSGDAPLQYTLVSDSDWLQLDQPGGVIAAGDNATLSFSALCRDLVEQRDGVVSVDSNAGGATIPVALSCTALPMPELQLADDPIQLSALQNQSANGSLVLANSGNATLQFNVASDSDWLQLTQSNGEILAGDSASLAFTAACGEVVEQRNATLSVTGNGGSASLAVVLNCSAIPAPVLQLADDPVLLSALQNQTASGDIVLSNSGNAVLQYSVTSDSDWLQPIQPGGEIAAGDSASLAFSATCSGAVEQRNGTLSVSGNGGNATIPVVLNCSAIPAPVLQLANDPVVLSALQNQSASGDIVLTNSGNAALQYSAASDSAWLQPVLSSGEIAAGESATLAFNAACGESVEQRSGLLMISSDGGEATILVELNCTATPAPELQVTNLSIELIGLQTSGGTDIVIVANTGTAALDVQVESDSAWLQPAFTQTTLDAGDDVELVVIGSCNGVVEMLSGNITISGGARTETVAVSLNCTALSVPVLSVESNPVLVTALQNESTGLSISIVNTGSAILDLTFSTDSSWLTPIAEQGTIAGGLRNAFGFDAQCGDIVEQRSGNIIIDSNGGDATVPVLLDCTATPMAILDIGTTELSLVANTGESVAGVISLQNSGSAVLDYTIATQGDWLTVADANNDTLLSLAAGASRELDVLASCGSDIETLNGEVSFSSGPDTSSVPVTLDCQAAILRVEPLSIELSGDIGSAFDSMAQGNLAIFNDGNALLEFTVVSDSDWLCLDDPGSGSCDLGVLSFSETVLPGEFYSLPIAAECNDVEETRSGQFDIDSNGGTASIPVELQCVTADVPDLAISPLQFDSTLNLNEFGLEILMLENVGSAPLSYDVSSETVWLAVPMNSGTLEPGQSEALNIDYFCEGNVEMLNGELIVGWDLGTEIVPFTLNCEGGSADVVTVDFEIVNSSTTGEDIIWGRPTQVMVSGSGFSTDIALSIEGGECSVVSVTFTDIEGECVVTDSFFRDITADFTVTDLVEGVETVLDQRPIFVDPRGYNRVDEISRLALEVGVATELTISGIFNSSINVLISDGPEFDGCNVLSDGLTEIVAECVLATPNGDQLVLNTSDGVDVENGTADLIPVQLFDDFSTDNTRWSVEDNTSGQAVNSSSFDSGEFVVRVDSQSNDRERVRLRSVGVVDTVAGTMAIDPESMATGTSRVHAQLNLTTYNELADGGSSGRTRDVGFYHRIEFIGESNRRFSFGAFVYTDEDTIEDYEILDGTNFHVFENIIPEPGVSYDLAIAVDRANQTVTFSVDNQFETFALPTPLFQPSDSFVAVQGGTDRGPASAVVRISSASTEISTADLSDPETFGIYNASDDSQADRTVQVQNNAVLLESTSTGDSNDSRLRIPGLESNYIGANMRLTDESIALDGGTARGRAGGSFFYAVDNPGANGLFGLVFAVSELALMDDGTVQARYCAFQSTDAEFNSALLLTNPDDESGCLLFDTVPVRGQDYLLETWLDESTRRLYFAIDGEVRSYDITTVINSGEAVELSLRTRTSGAGSRSVVIADDLRLSILSTTQ